MTTLIAVDAQLFRTNDGKIWTKSIYDYEFWTRYLDVFDDIIVVSRIKDVEIEYVRGFLRSDGKRVSFSSLPYARGMKQYLQQLPGFLKKAKESTEYAECAIIRLPSIAAMFVDVYYKKTKKPYALEIVVDPVNAYAENRLAQMFLTWHLKDAALRANGVSYVTQYALQQQYPSYIKTHCKDQKHFEAYYSSITLKDTFFATPKQYQNHRGKYRIVHTANNINNSVKGHDVVIKMIRMLRDRGIAVTATFIGDGVKRNEFEQLAESLNVREYISFTGMLASANQVREVLISADIFVFPTKAEGLPRAIIEAMAVGLPCVSTPVNGIPELLEREYLVDPLDVDGFAHVVESLILNPEKLNEISERNIAKAREYETSVLQKRRNEYYESLKKLAEEFKQ